MLKYKGNNEIKLTDGNKVFLKDLFNIYYPILNLFAKKFIPDDFVCEDIVQNVFISFWGNKKSYLNLNAVKSFLYTSTKNSCLDYLKHDKVEKKYMEYIQKMDESVEPFLEEVLKNEAYAQLYSEINKLPEMEKKVLFLALKENTNQEIAELLQISVNTVRTHKARAYKVLRKNLGDLFFLLFV